MKTFLQQINSKKGARLGLFTFLILTLIMSQASPVAVWAQVDPRIPHIPGSIEGTGTHFEVTDSKYINITLDSSAPVKLTLESVPEMVTMHIETASAATSAVINLSGFIPSTTYHKYEDDYHNHVAFTTDAGGKYTYTQDLSKAHLIFIQPRSSTKFISDDLTGGDCASIGTWDQATKTCTLTADLNETIQIDSDGITLDGSGHTLTGSNTGSGVFLEARMGCTVENLNVQHFTFGIYLYDGSRYNTITGNTASSNGTGINLFATSDNTLTGNTASSNGTGIHLDFSDYNTLTGNTANSNSYHGIGLNDTYSNTLTGNTARLNGFDGIHLGGYCNGINITGNTASSNMNGITLHESSDNNTLTGNTVSSNSFVGIYFAASSNNQIYNNNFSNNTTQASGSGNVFNLPAPTGGNYWSDYDTPAEGCSDANSDGFCDAPYIFSGGQDNLPWTRQNGWELPADIIPPITTITLSGTPGNNGWFISDVQVTLAATDNAGGSGVKNTEYSLDGVNWTTYAVPFTITAEGTTVYCRSTDDAGNVEPTRTEAIKIDKTPPTVSIITPANGGQYLLNQSLIADWSAADPVSGIAWTDGTVPSGQAINTGNVGTKAFTVVATDNAGNRTTLTATYYVSYALGGVLQPINSYGGSVFKLGSTVPVKFQLTDANGSNVSTATAGVYVAKINDSVTGTEAEADSTSAATSGNQFRYDSASNQYIFNLSTKSMSTGTWQIRISLDDGTSKYVNISLR